MRMTFAALAMLLLILTIDSATGAHALPSVTHLPSVIATETHNLTSAAKRGTLPEPSPATLLVAVLFVSLVRAALQAGRPRDGDL